ncbi:MAG: rhamnulokinase [Anaerolineae bacterium]|nr:rhamnulokinase [Anaerolineae bacterium]
MASKTVLAIDLGAESGRVMAVHFDGASLKLEELHRFSNPVTDVRGTLYWDFLHLWRSIQHGIEKGKALNPASLGVDTWAVDFGLLDSHGDLIGGIVQYRDRRTDGMMERVFEIVPRAEIFAQTGIQFMQLNTLYQLMSMVLVNSPQLEIASTFLTVPDLLNYWMTGEKVCEFSNATTTQMVNPLRGSWAADMLNRLGMPTNILPEIVPPGTKLGSYNGIPVIAPATHDTGSAVAAVPATNPNFAYISSGTWSLVGLEIDAPIVNEAALQANVTNEGGVNDTYRLLKNVMGLWIVQQCRATWAAQGRDYSYAELVSLAEQSPQLQGFIDVDDDRFLHAGDHPNLLQQWCAEHGQIVPQTAGAIVRRVLESLALKYRAVLERLSQIADRKVEVIYVVGGGSQNHLLNQFTANATGCTVIAGPVEATVIGNAAVQLIAQGELRDINEARQIIARIEGQTVYQPQNRTAWDQAYSTMQQL